MNAKQLVKIFRKYAEKQGFQLQPDKKFLDEIINGLLENERKFGYRYCPCRVITGDRFKDARIICPCTYHKEEVRTMGHCLCRLFVAEPK